MVAGVLTLVGVGVASCAAGDRLVPVREGSGDIDIYSRWIKAAAAKAGCSPPSAATCSRGGRRKATSTRAGVLESTAVYQPPRRVYT